MIKIENASFKIKQYDVDPTNPKSESAWVLKTAGAGGSTAGMPMGLLMALTYAVTSAGGGPTTYQLSYRTKDGTTKRVSLT